MGYVDGANDVNCANVFISSVSADCPAEVDEVCGETACRTETYQLLLLFRMYRMPREACRSYFSNLLKQE